MPSRFFFLFAYASASPPPPSHQPTLAPTPHHQHQQRPGRGLPRGRRLRRSLVPRLPGLDARAGRGRRRGLGLGAVGGSRGGRGAGHGEDEARGARAPVRSSEQRRRRRQRRGCSSGLGRRRRRRDERRGSSSRSRPVLVLLRRSEEARAVRRRPRLVPRRGERRGLPAGQVRLGGGVARGGQQEEGGRERRRRRKRWKWKRCEDLVDVPRRAQGPGCCRFPFSVDLFDFDGRVPPGVHAAGCGPGHLPERWGEPLGPLGEARPVCLLPR